MLVRWLRKDECELLAEFGRQEGWIIASDEIQKTQQRFSHLCFGAQIDNEFVGGLTSYLHENSAWIGNFIVKKEHRGFGVGTKIFECAFLALQNERQSLYLCAALPAVKFYEKFGFVAQKDIVRLCYTPDENQTKHTKSFLSELTSDNFVSHIQKLDKRFFGESRKELLQDIQSKSSLFLTHENGFCHSKIIDYAVALGPWEMALGAFMDAEKILRTTLAIRGQRKIYVDLCVSATDALALYKEYGFVECGKTILMCHGEPLALRYENIYAFASLGSKG